MKILIVAATFPEIEPLVRYLEVLPGEGNTFSAVDEAGNTITVLITGIGLMRTAYFLGKSFSETRHDLAINVGIAGSFSRNVQIGQVVHVVSDQITDLGVENEDFFSDLFDLALEEREEFPYKNGMLLNESRLESAVLPALPQVRGSTVNRVHGNQTSIDETVAKYSPDVESMEGAAFFFSCIQENIPFIQIRSISNYVEKRDKSKWNIPLAIQHLNETLISLLTERSLTGA